MKMNKIIAGLLAVLFLSAASFAIEVPDLEMRNPLTAVVSDGKVVFTDTSYSSVDEGFTYVYYTVTGANNTLSTVYTENIVPLVKGQAAVPLQALNMPKNATNHIYYYFIIKLGDHRVRSYGNHTVLLKNGGYKN